MLKGVRLPCLVLTALLIAGCGGGSAPGSATAGAAPAAGSAPAEGGLLHSPAVLV